MRAKALYSNRPALDLRPPFDDSFRAHLEQLNAVVGYYDEIASEYDTWFNGIYSKVSRRMVEFAIEQARRPLEVGLDIGCGTGLALRHLADLGDDVQEMIGLDPSRGMIEVARQVCRPPHRLLLGTAADFRFDPDSVDLLTFGNSLVELNHPERSLAAAFTILRSGGVVALYGIQKSLWAPAQELYFDILPTLARDLGVQVPAPTPASISLGEPEAMAGMLERVGFVDIKTTQYLVGGSHTGAREWNDFMVGCGAFPYYVLKGLADGGRKVFESLLTRHMESLGDDAFRFHLAFLIAVGRKP